MNDLGLIKNFTANGTINKRRITAFGAAEGEAVQASADTAYLGVSGIRGAAQAGSRIDVYMDGFCDVEFGGAVAYGDPLTSDADGKAIAAAPGAGVTMNILGRAMTSGVAGSYGPAHIAPQQITG